MIEVDENYSVTQTEYTVKDLAKMLEMTEVNTNRLIRMGRIPAPTRTGIHKRKLWNIEECDKKIQEAIKKIKSMKGGRRRIPRGTFPGDITSKLFNIATDAFNTCIRRAKS